MADEPPPGRKTPPAAIVGSVIGLAIVVALGAWFLLLRPGPEHRICHPVAISDRLASDAVARADHAEPTTGPTDNRHRSRLRSRHPSRRRPSRASP